MGLGQWCPSQLNSKVPKVGQIFTFIFYLPPPASLPDFQILSQVDTQVGTRVALVGLLGLVGLVGLVCLVGLVGLMSMLVGLKGLAAFVDLDPAGGHLGPPTLPYSCLLTYNDRFKRLH